MAGAEGAWRLDSALLGQSAVRSWTGGIVRNCARNRDFGKDLVALLPAGHRLAGNDGGRYRAAGAGAGLASNSLSLSA